MRCKTAESDVVGDPGNCDVCGRPLGDEVFVCDAELPAHDGRWGMLCKTCTMIEGIRPGWGRALFYEGEPSLSSGATVPSNPADVPWRCLTGGFRATFPDCLDLCCVAGTLSRRTHTSHPESP